MLGFETKTVDDIKYDPDSWLITYLRGELKEKISKVRDCKPARPDGDTTSRCDTGDLLLGQIETPQGDGFVQSVIAHLRELEAERYTFASVGGGAQNS